MLWGGVGTGGQPPPCWLCSTCGGWRLRILLCLKTSIWINGLFFFSHKLFVYPSPVTFSNLCCVRPFFFAGVRKVQKVQKGCGLLMRLQSSKIRLVLGADQCRLLKDVIRSWFLSHHLSGLPSQTGQPSGLAELPQAMPN